jgi:hypothetical protein
MRSAGTRARWAALALSPLAVGVGAAAAASPPPPPVTPPPSPSGPPACGDARSALGTAAKGAVALRYAVGGSISGRSSTVAGNGHVVVLEGWTSARPRTRLTVPKRRWDRFVAEVRGSGIDGLRRSYRPCSPVADATTWSVDLTTPDGRRVRSSGVAVTPKAVDRFYAALDRLVGGRLP